MKKMLGLVALGVATLLAPMIASAAPKETIAIVIANERAQIVTAQTPALENCYPDLNVRIAPGSLYHYQCTVWEEGKFSRVVRLVLPDSKIGCEGMWTPGKFSVPYMNNGAKCTIQELSTGIYRYTIR